MLLNSSSKISALIIASAFLFPSAVLADTCPVLSSGQMIKVGNKPAIYTLNTNKELLYFPSGEEYKSWQANDSYGGYTSITEQCFDSLPIPARPPFGVNFRPGSYLVKQSTAEQLYVIQPGNSLRKITNTAAQTLYSTVSIKIISPLFWSNYTVSNTSEISTNAPHAGMLLANVGTFFYVDATNHLRSLSEAALVLNNLKQSFFRPTDNTTLASLQSGEPINSYQPALADPSQISSPSSSTSPAQPLAQPVIGGSLLVRNGLLTTIIKPIFNFELPGKPSDSVRFHIQLDDSSDFASPLMDFLSHLEKPGVRRFVFGSTLSTQGTFLIGGKDQLLASGVYYWRVKTIDKSGNESSYTVANNGNAAFITDTTLVPNIDLHYVVISSAASHLTKETIRAAQATIQQHFISDSGEQLVRFNYKSAALYDTFKSSSCGDSITSDRPLWTYKTCKDTSILDPKTINLLISNDVASSFAFINKPFIVITLKHLLSIKAQGHVQAHELGHTLGLHHVCDPVGIINVMSGHTACSSSSTEIPMGDYFGDQQSATIRKSVANYVESFSKL